ncbi:GH35 family beta-galactosidase [Duganella sp. PWIR1]
MKRSTRQLVVSLSLMMAAAGAAAASEIPQIVKKDGRFALIVDGAPFVILGGQAQNSSNYPLALNKVWAAIKDMNANTLEIPVAWEQIEQVEGKFDFSYVDTLVAEARKNKVKLVLLWFGTWKNTGPNYVPEWVKFNNARFPRMLDKDGKNIYCLSPQGEETLKADKKAFVALMAHIKKIDEAQRTVIMMQVENEVGTYGFARDYAPKAEAQFNQPVPQAVLDYKKSPVALAKSGTWKQVYGDYADEYFHAYSIASYIEEIAKAGRAVYNLPMFVNNALRDSLESPVKPWKENFASGGPTYDVIDIYRAAAPHIDFAGPDVYGPDSKKFTATLDHFQRKDNPLMVPEISNAPEYVRYTFQVLGRGAIGFSPFGIDYADYSNFPLGHKATDKTMTEPFGKIYAAFRPMERQWAKWAFEGRTYGIAEGDDRQPQTVDMKGWKATISFREWQFGEQKYFKDVKDVPAGTEKPNGGVAIAQIGENEFIIIGQRARVKIDHAAGKPSMWARVEEGRYDAAGKWIMERNWNGDQTDYGLNLTGNPVVLKVKLGTY